MNRKKLFISDLSEVKGEFSDIFKIGVIESARTRLGKKFYSILLKDKTGVIKSKLWNDKIEQARGLKSGDIVNVTGKTNQYGGSFQIIIKQIEKSDYGNEEDFSILSEKKIIDLSLRLNELIDSVNDISLKKLLKDFFDDPDIRTRFVTYPAAKIVHHCYRGGLLEHSVSMADVAKILSTHYALNTDLMVAGALLHDIGKLYELTENGEYTRRGKLIGHLSIGVTEIEKRVEADIPIIVHLEHLIASHHGLLEWGAIKKPQTPEAELLFNIDFTDSRQNIMKLKSLDMSNNGDDTTLKVTKSASHKKFEEKSGTIPDLFSRTR